MTGPEDPAPNAPNAPGSGLRDRKDESYALKMGGARRESLREAAKMDPRLYDHMTGGIGPDGPDGYSLRKRLGSRRVAVAIGVIGTCLLVLTLVILSHVLGGRTAAPVTTEGVDLNTASPRLFAIQFLEAANIFEKAKLCRYPDEARSQIAHFYGKGASTADDYSDLRGLGLKMESGMNAYHFHVVLNDNSSRLLPVLSREDGSYAVDWECFARLGSMSWDDFLGASTAQGVFRAYVTPGNYYNFDFEDKKQHVCFTVNSPDLEHRIYAYADRSSVLAQTIRKSFGDQKGARLMVKLATAPDGMKNRQAKILELVSASWIEPDK